MSDPKPRGALERDIAAGDLGAARRRLASYIRSVGFSAEMCERIARISVMMRDPAEAGRWYFAIDSSDPEAEGAISVFVESCGGG